MKFRDILNHGDNLFVEPHDRAMEFASMTNFRIRGAELRRLGSLLAALLEDSELMAELSLMEREHIQGARAALSPLLPIVDARDMEDTANES